MKKILRTILLACAFFVAGNAAAQVLYGADGAGGNAATILYTINPANGVATAVGPIGFAVTGLAFHPITGVLYGSTGGNAPISPNSLIRIDTATGAGTLIGANTQGPLADLEFRSDGVLLAWCECSDELATVNLNNGVATIVGPNAITTSGSGLAYVGGRLFLAGDGNDGVLSIINPASGAASAGPTLSGSPGVAGNSISALATRGGTLFGVDLADVGGGGAAFLVTINTTTGAVTSVGATIAGLDAIAFAPLLLAPAQVPTMSEWALILMALLMAAAAFWVYRKRT